MSGKENPQTQALQNDASLQYDSLEPGHISAEMQRKIKLIDPMYPHDIWSGLQVGFLMFFVFLGAQALRFSHREVSIGDLGRRQGRSGMV